MQNKIKFQLLKYGKVEEWLRYNVNESILSVTTFLLQILKNNLKELYCSLKETVLLLLSSLM